MAQPLLLTGFNLIENFEEIIFINCQYIIVLHRFIVAASHCYDDFANGAAIGVTQVKANTIRYLQQVT